MAHISVEVSPTLAAYIATEPVHLPPMLTQSPDRLEAAMTPTGDFFLDHAYATWKKTNPDLVTVLSNPSLKEGKPLIETVPLSGWVDLATIIQQEGSLSTRDKQVALQQERKQLFSQAPFRRIPGEQHVAIEQKIRRLSPADRAALVATPHEGDFTCLAVFAEQCENPYHFDAATAVKLPDIADIRDRIGPAAFGKLLDTVHHSVISTRTKAWAVTAYMALPRHEQTPEALREQHEIAQDRMDNLLIATHKDPNRKNRMFALVSKMAGSYNDGDIHSAPGWGKWTDTLMAWAGIGSVITGQTAELASHPIQVPSAGDYGIAPRSGEQLQTLANVSVNAIDTPGQTQQEIQFGCSPIPPEYTIYLPLIVRAGGTVQAARLSQTPQQIIGQEAVPQLNVQILQPLATVNIGEWASPSYDPAGITFDPVKKNLIVTDPEAREIPSPNLSTDHFRADLDGTFLGAASFAGIDDEPAGVAYMGTTSDGKTIEAIANDDTGIVSQIEQNPTNGELHKVSGVRYKPTVLDPEDIGVDPDHKRAYFPGGDQHIFQGYQAGDPNCFSGPVENGGHDLRVVNIDTARIGVRDGEGQVVQLQPDGTTKITLISNADPLMTEFFLPDQIDPSAPITTVVEPVTVYDLSLLDVLHAGGVTVAPDKSGVPRFVVVERRVDNNDDLNEKDGRMDWYATDPMKLSNVLTNSDFSNGTAGWTTTGDVQIMLDQRGNPVAVLTGKGNQSARLSQQVPVPVSAGEKVNLEVQIRPMRDGSPDGRLNLRVRERDAAGNVRVNRIIGTETEQNADEYWHLLAYTIAITDTTVTNVVAEVAVQPAGGTVLTDTYPVAVDDFTAHIVPASTDK